MATNKKNLRDVLKHFNLHNTFGCLWQLVKKTDTDHDVWKYLNFPKTSWSQSRGVTNGLFYHRRQINWPNAWSMYS